MQSPNKSDAAIEITSTLTDRLISINPSTQLSPPDAKVEPVSESSCWQVVRKTLSFVLFGIGVGAGCLYVNAAIECIASETCGISTVNFFHKFFSLSLSLTISKWIFLLSGALGFSGSNGYYSSQFFDKFYEYIDSFDRASLKAVMATLIILLGVSQTSQILLAVIATSLQKNGSVADSMTDIMTWVTVGGALPGYLFGAIGLIKETIPQFFKSVYWGFCDYIYYPCFSAKNEESKNYRDEMNYYAAIQPQFLSHVDANLATLSKEAKQIEPLSNKSGKDLLLEKEAAPTPYSFWHSLGSWVCWAGAVYAAAAFSYPILAGSWAVLHGISAIAAYPGLDFALTSLISVSVVYTDFKILTMCAETFNKLMMNVLNWQPLESMSFQLFPKITTGITAAFTLLSIMSYSAINIMWDNSPNFNGNESLRDSARSGIDIYHAYALILFGIEMVKLFVNKFYPNHKANKLFQAETEKEKLHNQHRDEFKDYVENKMTVSQRQTMNIQTYSEAKAAKSLQVGLDTSSLRNQGKASSCCSRFFNRQPSLDTETYKALPTPNARV